MSRRTVILIFLLIVVPVMVYFFIPTDRTRIQKLINKGAAAIEKEDEASVMACVSFNYRDDYGMTYLYLKESFKRLFQRRDGISVDYEVLDIELDDNIAVAKLRVRVLSSSGSGKHYIVGSVAEPLDIILILEKEKLKWQVTRTEGVNVLPW